MAAVDWFAPAEIAERAPAPQRRRPVQQTESAAPITGRRWRRRSLQPTAATAAGWWNE